ncbi:MAG: hypothetical protein E7253_03865 [Lachnospiraceae bacterium]|nr:hypothetical protein [Lachnospiraceae bacterium]
MNHKEHWWHQCVFIKRYMPEQDRYTYKQIIKELPKLKQTGYHALQITAPYLSSGFYPWWGLRVKDYFKPNIFLADTMNKFTELVDEVHQQGLKVLVFMNFGYGELHSDTWKNACKDKRNGVNSKEKQYFCWKDEHEIQKKGSHFLQGGRWAYSSEAGAWYWSYWGYDGNHEPQYNWHSKDFQSYVKKILTFWMNTGIDGVIVDAVNWYLNCDWQIIKTCVTDIIHSYPSACCIPEGGTGFGDDYLPWIEKGGFDIIEDQTFESDVHWNGSAVMDALKMKNAEPIRNRLAVCVSARQRGIPSWSYLSWDQSAWTPKRRLMEIAILLATGHMIEIIPDYLKNFSKTELEAFEKLLSYGKYDCFAPICKRKELVTEKKTHLFVLMCEGKEWDGRCEFDFSKGTYQFNILPKK